MMVGFPAHTTIVKSLRKNMRKTADDINEMVEINKLDTIESTIFAMYGSQDITRLKDEKKEDAKIKVTRELKPANFQGMSGGPLLLWLTSQQDNTLITILGNLSYNNIYKDTSTYTNLRPCRYGKK